MKISLKQGELTGKEEISVPSGRTYHSYLDIMECSSSTPNIKYDWYQTDSKVVITILVKNVTEENFRSEFNPDAALILIKTPSEYNLSLNLSNQIIPEKSSYKLFPSKIEINLAKSNSIRWETLEKKICSKPKTTKNWDAVAKQLEDDKDVDSVESLFTRIYSDGTDDQKRAMLKSFYESGGTVLSTNWSEVGKQKVEAPKPHKGWDGILEATKPGPPCHQKMVYVSPQPFGQEDCLYVNVHVPESTDKCLKPVMVYVHGGGFINGCGDFYQPTYLMEYDIIVVTFNYRLHVLGFLNLGIPQCPGNVGLKDQVLLFQWVRENISAFGGDPNNITAVGESAGAASIHYLMISPLGKGLFDRAIIQSGSALCPWAFTEKQTKFAFQFGEILGCITSDEKELYNFLLEVDVVKLGGAARKLTSQLVNGNELVFVPSLESADNVEPKFLPEHPEELIKKTIPVPLITGINDLEALIFFTEMPNDLLINIWEDVNIIPSALRTKTDILSLQQKFKTFYLRDQIPSYGTLPQSIDLLTDKSFAHPFHRTVQTQLQHHPGIPIYAYKFSYVGQLNLHKTLISTLYPDLNFEGTSHTDELSYLFNLKTSIHIDLNEESLRMIRTMCTLWTNFIKYGTPTLSSDSVKWNRYLLNDPCYLHIDDEPLVKYEQINEDRMHFWDNLYKEARARNIKLKL